MQTRSAALVTKTGGAKACSTGQVVYLTARGGGTIQYYTNGVLRNTKYLSVTQSATWKSGSMSVSSWKITSDGALYDSGASAWCGAADGDLSPTP